MVLMIYIVTFWVMTSYSLVHKYYSFKYTNKMQCYTIFFITVNALHV